MTKFESVTNVRMTKRAAAGLGFRFRVAGKRDVVRRVLGGG